MLTGLFVPSNDLVKERSIYLRERMVNLRVLPYLFNKVGVLNFAPGTSEEEVMEAALEAGADDVISADDGSIEVITTPEAYEDVKSALEQAGLVPENAEVTMRASIDVELDAESGEKVLRLLDALEDLDDTQDVYSNADIPDEAYN